MVRTTTRGRDDWKTALDQLTIDHAGDRVTIDALDPTLGPHTEARQLPFSYTTYDPKDDVVIVAVGGHSSEYPVVLRHMVWHPTEVDIATGDLPQPAVRLVESDGTTTLVTFHADDQA